MRLPPAIVPDLLRQRAAEAPGDVALVADGIAELSYREWDERSNAAARGLVALGVAEQQPVALVFANRDWIDYAVGYLAVLKAGAVAVPLGPRFAGSELQGIMQRCGVGGVIGGADVPTVADGAGWLSLAELEAGQRTDAFQAPVTGSDLAEILYTSGTTGLAKGVACSHAGVLFHAPPPEPDTPGRASVVHAFPVGTNAGQELLRLPLRRPDRTAVILARFDPDRYCQVIGERRIRRLQLVPSMAQLIVASGAAHRFDVSSVERVVLSSAPCPPAVIAAVDRAFPNAVIWNTYALTEAGTARTLNTDAMARPDSVGRPVGDTQLRTVDEDGIDVAPGSVGEVLLRHPGSPGRWYYRDSEASARTFDADGWVHTGDLGAVDATGSLVLVDRKKDLIIVGGLNVSSVEVENVLFEHPAVADVAVFGIEHPILGQDVAAAVVSRQAVGPAELQSFVRDRRGEHEVPHRIVFVDQLPKTATGKVRKAELRQTYSEVVPTDHVDPRTEDEAAIVDIWRRVLGRDDLGVEDDFFELGGHSLAAAQIVNRIEELWDVTLPLLAVFEAPTPATLAAAVVQARAEAVDDRGTGEGAPVSKP